MPWRPQDRRATYGADYRRKRDAAMQRANWRCEIRLEGCRGTATECDHIYGVTADPGHNHLRAACHDCHAKVTRHNRGSGQRDPDPKPWTTWDSPPLEERTKW
jgi:5-methylcytosine-specific restriction enzyme A